MAVVKEGMIGNTKYKIHDDAYINRSPEEIAETVRRRGEINSRACMRIEEERLKKEGGENAS